MMKTEWQKIYNGDVLVYEGFTINGKPYGAGTTYYKNGNKFEEGVFDVKGFVAGKIYYPTGDLRFVGAYEVNHGYGPNYPKFGRYYAIYGELLYEGVFENDFGGVGYRMTQKPETFKQSEPKGKPKVQYAMWADVKEE